MTTVKTLSLPCPTCKKEVLMTKDSPFRPFCSARCKSIDFGDWALENHKIAGEPLQEFDELLGEETGQDPES